MIAFDLAHVREILSRTPTTLETMLAGLPDPWWKKSEGGSTWSPFDIMGHLVHGEEADWIPRARLILEEPERPFDPFDGLAQVRESRGKTPSDLLAEFRILREENLATLADLALTAEQLDRTGIHPDFGTVTLRQLLATWAVHDLVHIGQISRVMLRQYSDAVGPWREYISLLADWREP